MKKEELIGKKVRGFRFERGWYNGLQFADEMNNYYIGKVGTIVEYNKTNNRYKVEFEVGYWLYPAELIEQHLVEEPTIEINYNHISVRICEDNSLIGYYTDDCGITSFGKTFDELLRNLQHAKKAIDEARERLAKEDLEEAKIKANKGVDINIDCKSSNDLKLESLNRTCIDYGKIEHDPLDDLPIIGDGVLMEVSDDEEKWFERKICGNTKLGLFIAWIEDEGKTFYAWKYARPIPKTKITRKEFETKFEIID